MADWLWPHISVKKTKEWSHRPKCHTVFLRLAEANVRLAVYLPKSVRRGHMSKHTNIREENIR